MDLTDVQPSGKRFFTLESGRLLITDPNYSGYPEEMESELLDKRGQKSVTYFPQGASYYYPEDSLFNVYRTNSGLWIARHGENTEAIERSVNKKIFGSQIESLFSSKSKEKQKEREMKKRGFLFLASTDVCTMLIGDQEVFGLKENDFVFAHHLQYLFDEEKQRPMAGVDYNEKRKRIEEGLRESATGNHKQVVKMTLGRYSCRVKPNGLEVNLL